MPKYPGVTKTDGGSYKYRIKKKINGKPVDICRGFDEITGEKFLKASDAYDAKVRHEQRLKETTPAPRKTATVDEIYALYKQSADGKSKADGTIRKQDSIMRIHISPEFGSRDINSITIAELETYLWTKYQHLSYRFVEGHLKQWYLLFGVADKHELVDKDRYYRMFVNRGTKLGMPKKTQADEEDDLRGAATYSDEELLIMKTIFQRGNLYTAYMLGIYTGVRVSECFGLRWSDIEWGERRIRVSRQMQYTQGRITLTAVKTITSVRTVPMCKELEEVLIQAYEQQVKDRERLGEAWRGTEKVYDTVTKQWIQGADFVNRKPNGELLTVNSLKFWTKEISDKAEIEFKYHWLRHTFASNCAASNISVLLLQTWMGHKKLDTTQKYYIDLQSNRAMMDKALDTVSGMYDLEWHIHAHRPISDAERRAHDIQSRQDTLMTQELLKRIMREPD